jgi:hypothetical protein
LPKTLLPNVRFIHHLIRPTRGGAAAVLIVFAFLLFIAAKAGLVGIPLALIVISWFFKYAYILFDHTVNGYDEPPTLDIQMLNPIDEQRPLAQVAILGLIYLAVNFLQHKMGPTPAIVLAAFVLLLLPASVAVLGLEGNILKAAYPVAWVRMVIGLGPMYALVLGVIAAYAVLIVFLWRSELWLPVQITIFMFCILSVFSVLGGALYERRHELGLDTHVSPERTEERKVAKVLRQSENYIAEAYGQMRAGSHVKSYQMLNDWLERRGNSPVDYHWLCTRVATWDDPRYLTRLTQDYVERLLNLKRANEALEIVAERLEIDPDFRPGPAAVTLQVARLAVQGGGSPRLARALLEDFSTRFADDQSVPAATELASHLGFDPPDDAA